MKTARIPTGSLIAHPVCRTNPMTSRRMRMVCGLALAVIGLSASVTPAYAVTATGGTVTTYTVGGITYNVHTFTGSGTFHVTAGGDVRYLVVGGGGGGGTTQPTGGGGGGAGGFLGGGSADTITVSAIDYTVTVGGGGAAGANGAAGTNGQNSVFGSITAIGGGGGTAVTPVPATGYHFLNWSDASTSNPRQDLAVSGDITVTANFAINTYSDWATANRITGGVNGDSNNDGVQNGVAYFMGVTGQATNPGLNAGNQVTWPVNLAYQGTFDVQISPDLVTWAAAVPQPTPSGGNLTYTLPSGLVKRFVRLVVTPN